VLIPGVQCGEVMVSFFWPTPVNYLATDQRLVRSSEEKGALKSRILAFAWVLFVLPNSSLLQSRYNCDLDLDLTVGRERRCPGAWRRSAAGLLADRHDADHTIRRATNRVDHGQQGCQRHARADRAHHTVLAR